MCTPSPLQRVESARIELRHRAVDEGVRRVCLGRWVRDERRYEEDQKAHAEESRDRPERSPQRVAKHRRPDYRTRRANAVFRNDCDKPEIAAGSRPFRGDTMENVESDLRARAERWANEDPDPETREELFALLSAPDLAKTDLADRFAATLGFGTAGLRGILGAGPNRMNRAVVLRTTWGLARELLVSCGGRAKGRVVVGYDGRRYSREFALDTALALAAGGFPAPLSARPVPPPLVAFAVTHLGALAGVMVPASHNPAEYNGYKLYWANGAQIIPPFDERVAARITEAPAATDVPRLAWADAKGKGLLVDLGEEVEASYLEAMVGLRVHRDGDRSFPIAYTALHGVGDALARRVLENVGFSSVMSVPEQREPDGAFPTVLFPNPEEKGAMD